MISSAPADKGAAQAAPELWVVMPVFNEAAALRPVVGEWLPVLTRCTGAVRLCVVDDGSTDATPAVLRELAAAHTEIEPVRRTNGGHGRACLHGYRLGLARGARWIAQIDSDGQCDASSFPELWSLRDRHPVVFGHRRIRLDGWCRRLVSRTLALGAASVTGVSVRDPNVPYRLVDAAVFRDAVDAVPDDVELVNVYLAVLLEVQAGIHWVDIVFRERLAGRSHLGWRSMLSRGLGVLRQLHRDRNQLRRRGAARGGGRGW